jgi:hypothetical protein
MYLICPPTREIYPGNLSINRTGTKLLAKGRESMRKIDASWEARLGKDRMHEMRSALSEVLELCRL